MNIYVETNFVLELTFEQEQCNSCEQILQLCETSAAKLIIPAYSLAEPHEKLYRQAKKRKEIQRLLNDELQQLSRTASYESRIQDIQNLRTLIVQSNQEEQQRLVQYRTQLCNIGEVIPLNIDILKEASSYETTYKFSPQDAIVYASVISHLRLYKPQQACFLNRNTKDFDIPEIAYELEGLNCKMLPRFDQGYGFVSLRKI